MAEYHQWFVPGDGIAREVITADIQRYLGPDALVKPSVGNGVKGYFINAQSGLSETMINELRQDTQRWKAEGDSIPYQDSKTHYARQYYGSSEGRPSFGWHYSTSPYRHEGTTGYNFPSHGPRSAHSIDSWHTARELASHSASASQVGYSQVGYYQHYSAPGSGQQAGYGGPSYVQQAGYGASGYGQQAGYGLPSGRGAATYNFSSLSQDLHSGSSHRTQSPNFRPLTVPGSHQSTSLLAKISPLASEEHSRKISLMVTESFQTVKQDTETLNESRESVAVKCGWDDESTTPALANPVLTIAGRGKLGRGAIGEVDEVSTSAGLETLARKRITISRRRDVAARETRLVQDEITNMKSLAHPHIVKMIGSYQEHAGTWKHSYCLLMHPVGDRDLSEFLDDECRCIRDDPDEEKSILYSAWIMKWFGCLATALAYMHSRHIHHEDIKPKNIIHRGEHIYFTDFSSSRNFEAGQASSTLNPARASRLFAAPEALPTSEGDIDRHGSKSDVFSLGLVFVEMLTILEGRDIDGLHDYLTKNNGFGSQTEPKQYHRAVELMEGWFSTVKGLRMYKSCIQPMLKETRSARPSAAEVVRDIRARQPWNRTLACSCQARSERNSPEPHVIGKPLPTMDRSIDPQQSADISFSDGSPGESEGTGVPSTLSSSPNQLTNTNGTGGRRLQLAATHSNPSPRGSKVDTQPTPDQAKEGESSQLAQPPKSSRFTSDFGKLETSSSTNQTALTRGRIFFKHLRQKSHPSSAVSSSTTPALSNTSNTKDQQSKEIKRRSFFKDPFRKRKAAA